MLNLALKVRHPSAPRYGETISIWTYPIDRAEYLAAESYPGCRGSCAAAGRPRRTQPTVAGQFPTVRWRTVRSKAVSLLPRQIRVLAGEQAASRLPGAIASDGRVGPAVQWN